MNEERRGGGTPAEMPTVGHLRAISLALMSIWAVAVRVDGERVPVDAEE
jgi:hypothetical protein